MRLTDSPSGASDYLAVLDGRKGSGEAYAKAMKALASSSRGVVLLRAMPCHVISCYAMLSYVMLCYIMRFHATLCYAMLCYATLFYAGLC